MSTADDTTAPDVIREHIAAINAGDIDRIMATFHDDPYLNDFNRELWGTDQLYRFFLVEFVGDNIKMDVKRVIDRFGNIMVVSNMSGGFPESPIDLTTFYCLEDEKIATMFILQPNVPWPGPPARLAHLDPGARTS